MSKANINHPNKLNGAKKHEIIVLTYIGDGRFISLVDASMEFNVAQSSVCGGKRV